MATSSSLIDLVSHDWKQINLPSLRSDLDEKLQELDKLSKQNKAERKELAKGTKELKKCKKDEKLKKFGSVLKLYQTHIDHKDAECKFVFDAFLKVYQILSEAPDPIDALQSGQIEILTLQKQLLDYNELKMKLKSYENEFNGLKNQEITVTKLKEEIKKMESEESHKIALELSKQRKELSKQFELELLEKDTKCNDAKLQTKQLQNEVIELQQRLDELQNDLLSQSLSNQNNADNEEAAQTMLEEELDRANLTIMRLTKERDEFMARAKGNHSQNDSLQNMEMMRFETNTLKKRLSESKETNQTLQSRLDALHKEYQKLKDEYQTSTQKAQQSIDHMKEKLQRLPNEKEYALLKQKVSVLQHEFLSSNMDSNTRPHHAPLNISMDDLLNTKLQSLQSELSAVNLDLYAKKNELESYKAEYDEMKQQCEQQKLLIIKLENDLSHKIKLESEFESAIVGSKDEDALSKICGKEEEEKVQDGSVSIHITANEESGDASDAVDAEEDNSAFLIVCEQRDRFRTTLQKSEQNVLRLKSKLERISADNAQLKQENVALYSKMKFLENYQSVKKSHAQQMTMRRNVQSADDIELKYERLYEESINPFAEFRNKEKQKRINSLDWTEWIALTVGSTVLSKRVFRLFGVFYAIALHLLIFFTILHEYRSHGVFDSHSSHCGDQLPVVHLDLPPSAT